MADLEEAIAIARQAVEATPEDHPDRAMRFARTGVMEDLEEAIRIARQAVEATPEDHPDRPLLLNNLGARVGNKFSRIGVPANLDEAIQDHPGRPKLLSNLGVRLGDRFSQNGAMKDLQEAIAIARQAVETTPEDHPDWALRLSNLGVILGNRFLSTGIMADLEEAIYHPDRSGLHSCIGATVDLTDVGANLSDSALQDDHEAYQIAKTTSADKKVLLSRAVGLASDAAAIALHVNQDPISAIELLETGRGVIASSFTDLRDLLDTPTWRDPVSMVSQARSSSVVIDKRHQASKEMVVLLDEIRRQPGFQRFLVAATEQQMREAAAFGPIVILNISRHRCDALLIENARMRVLELHQLTRDEIQSRVGKSKSLLTLTWLWKVVAEPVLDSLGFIKMPGDGPLVGFPLHAAGNHLQSSMETVLDRVVSSYASSVKSIINTRQQRRRELVADQNLQVTLFAMYKTPEQGVLKHVIKEVNVVQGICASMGLPYNQPQPLRQAVLDDLATCRIFHFAGHGCTDATDPLKSLLLLQDWQDSPLSVESLLDKINLRSQMPFLAYLSACGTGQLLDDGSFDESIHLTNAFQLAGFRHVIGTLWEVDDALCVDMARMTYEFMSENVFSDESVSRGLHHDMRKLRDHNSIG
ncbi:hypothetical protein LX36DRAFT_684839 [Colletotrichum falcatum]|nr:hypothetical protein LX36DRAFT_684839 [Colletotrichum falcatum]